MRFLVILPLFFICAFAEVRQNHLLLPTLKELKGNTGRIIQGQTAATGQFPYQVGLSVRAFLSSSWCGGSLIHPQWVLTAAHCVNSGRSATVYLGATERLRPELSISVPKANLIYHADFNVGNSAQNDIALIKLPSPVKLSRKIQPVNLPRKSEAEQVLDGAPVVVSGWGKMADKGDVSNKLQYATLTVANGRACRDVFGEVIFTEKNICIETWTENKSTCQGDSGGPLVLLSNEVQVGVVSYGSSEGCETGYPIGFTRVASFLDWIEEKSGLTLK